MDFNAWLTARGFDPAALTDSQRTALQADWRASQNPAPTPANPGTQPANSFNQTMERLRGESAREERITTLVSEAVSTNRSRLDELERIGQEAIAGNWTETQTELALLRAVRPQASNFAGMNGSNRAPVTDQVLEVALLQPSGTDVSEYPEQVQEAAHKSYKGGFGLLQLLDVSARQNGYRGHAATKANLAEVSRFAFQPQASSGSSTISTPGILSNIANKYSRDAFNSVDQSILKIAAKRTVTDFKQITSYSLTADLTYREIAPGGKLEHGSLGETSATNQAKSYGRMLGLDRRDLINDDLGAYKSVNKKMGRGGAIKRNKVGWGVFLNNSSFFASGNNNVSTGAGSALGVAGLQAADTVFRLQTDPNGDLMGAKPVLLVVPTALRITANDLMDSSKKVATTTANTPLPDGNPFEGLFEVVSSPYMQDSTLTGYSAAAWYLLASPEDIAVIEACYLNGVDQPVVESAEMDFSTLGLLIRGVFDFGFALQEQRGGVRSAGS